MDTVKFTRGERVPFSEIAIGTHFYFEHKLYIRLNRGESNAIPLDPTDACLTLLPSYKVQSALLEEVDVAVVLPPFSHAELRVALIGMSSQTLRGSDIRDRLATLLRDYAANLVNQQRMHERWEQAASDCYAVQAQKKYFAIVVLADLLCIEAARLEMLTKQVVERLRASL